MGEARDRVRGWVSCAVGKVVSQGESLVDGVLTGAREQRAGKALLVDD